MLGTWFRRATRSSTPAPPGTGRVQTVKGPADAWTSLNPRLPDRIVEGLDRASLRVADRAASAVSRRLFLKRVGQVGLLVGLGLSGLLQGSFVQAYEETVGCNAYGDPPGGPCGNSPLCEPDRCTGQNCTDHGKRRDYRDNFCCGFNCTGSMNCWRENCCSWPAWNSYVSCCDCCAMGGTIGCTNCTGTKCVCRKAVGNPC